MYENLFDKIPLDSPDTLPLRIACNGRLFDCTVNSVLRMRRRVVQISKIGWWYIRGDDHTPFDVESYAASAAHDYILAHPQTGDFNVAFDYLGITVVCFIELIRKEYETPFILGRACLQEK